MRIGPWWIDVYTLRITGSVAIALLWLALGERQRWRGELGDHPGWWLLVLTAGILLFGRLAYVLENSGYFRQNPQDAVRLVRVGGIRGDGAFVGGIIGVIAWAYETKQSPWVLLGYLTPAGLLVTAGSWWACQAVGCACGQIATNEMAVPNWLIWKAPDLYHDVEPRYAVQALGVGWALVSASLGWRLRQNAALALPIYFAGATALTLLRGDPEPRVYGLRIDTLIYGVLSLLLAVYGRIYFSGGRAR